MLPTYFYLQFKKLKPGDEGFFQVHTVEKWQSLNSNPEHTARPVPLTEVPSHLSPTQCTAICQSHGTLSTAAMVP